MTFIASNDATTLVSSLDNVGIVLQAQSKYEQT